MPSAYPVSNIANAKFLNITGNKDAEKIVRIINRLYQNEHRIPRTGQPARYWTIEINMLPLSSKIKRELINIKNKSRLLPKSELSKAINYTLIYCSPLCFT